MNKIVSLLLLFLIIVSCNSDSNYPTEQKKCLITKYGKIITTEGHYFLNEFVYQNDRIIQNIKKNGFNNQINIEEVEYTNNLPSKIIINEKNFYSITYSNNILKEIVKSTIFDNGYIMKYIYKFTFENNKPKKIESYYLDAPNVENTITIFEYSNNNVSKVIETLTYENEDNVHKEITLYSDFDTNKNPFNNVNVPFLDLLPAIYSANNPRKIQRFEYFNNEQTSVSEVYSNIEYDLNGLPNFAEYKCE